MIPVTKPFLPPQEEYMEYINDIWNRNWLTNNGPILNDLELKLKEYLRLKHGLFLSNGTVAIQIAMKALNLKGEVITTPFSFVATTSSIVWESCKPVFVDIDKDTFNMDPTKIEAAITENTSAILATHVFGNPCDVEIIEAIAKKYGLKVIYDGAHCFGVKYKGKSLYGYGDITTASFHATKLYHTIEGGAVFSNDAELIRQMSFLRNFGHAGPETFNGIGINGKNSEFHAAMGVVNLKYIDQIMENRKQQSLFYNEKLKGLRVQKQKIFSNTEYNYSYYPVVFESEEILLESVKSLNEQWIHPRRYFYPSLNTLHYIQSKPMPVSEEISKRILCLPLYFGLTEEDQNMIARILLRVQNN